MILIVHVILGSAIGSLVNNVPLAIILALLSHYVLDFIPHLDYPVKNFSQKQWRKSVPEFLRIFFDFFAGMLLIYLFSSNRPIIYICGFIAAAPDTLTALKYAFPGNRFLEDHYKLHEKLHFWNDTQPPHKASARQEKISNFWRILSQATVIVISILLLKL